ncbi:MAG: response regulator transcription factor [Spirochaetales bacterium]|jgi:DNA-binding response OmpR family regulator|nr:response regulator transcription factor [Spirochaetales bacterium]
MVNTAIIIEDDREIAAIVATNIQDLGLETEQVSDGASGLKKVLNGSYSLVILDLMLPQLDGITVCKRIREKDPYTPILMLTAKAEEIDRVLGLELGADDYMTKPFSVRELKARVRALLRRAGTGLAPAETEVSRGEILIGALSVDLEKRKVVLGEVLLELTVKEFDLLELFISNPGRAYSRADLLNLVWGYQFEGYEHTVNTHINRLRNKIEADPAHPVYLKTVWGVGYRFAENTEVANS